MIRGHKTEPGMNPSDQSLDGLDLTGSEVELGLVMQYQLVRLDRLTELFSQAHVILPFVQVLDVTCEGNPT